MLLYHGFWWLYFKIEQINGCRTKSLALITRSQQKADLCWLDTNKCFCHYSMNIIWGGKKPMKEKLVILIHQFNNSENSNTEKLSEYSYKGYSSSIQAQTNRTVLLRLQFFGCRLDVDAPPLLFSSFSRTFMPPWSVSRVFSPVHMCARMAAGPPWILRLFSCTPTLCSPGLCCWPSAVAATSQPSSTSI